MAHFLDFEETMNHQITRRQTVHFASFGAVEVDLMLTFACPDVLIASGIPEPLCAHGGVGINALVLGKNVPTSWLPLHPSQDLTEEDYEQMAECAVAAARRGGLITIH